MVRRGEPNAFALPGGRIYVFQGLIERAETVDELAGVLAHEIGHVAHRDGKRSVLQGAGLSFLFGMLLGDFVGGGAVIFAAKTILQTSYSREVETAADGYGVELDAQVRRRPARARHHADPDRRRPRIRTEVAARPSRYARAASRIINAPAGSDPRGRCSIQPNGRRSSASARPNQSKGRGWRADTSTKSRLRGSPSGRAAWRCSRSWPHSSRSSSCDLDCSRTCRRLAPSRARWPSPASRCCSSLAAFVVIWMEGRAGMGAALAAMAISLMMLAYPAYLGVGPTSCP